MNKKIPNYEGLTDNTNIPNVFDQIVDLDLRYGKYIQCNNPNINPNNVLKCTSNDMNIETINKAYTKLMGDNISYQEWLTRNNKIMSVVSFKEYNEYISNNGSLVNALNTNTISKEEYNKNLHHIINKHKDILNLRKELDLKTQELNMIDNPAYNDYKAKHDASVYSGVLWTILASSLLYYLFIKI
jgi:hypothetical protein